ncbi:MAG TPA: amidase family protein, partial [Solirubrobacteraceae bacterium]|nr:amidase family protein [Solirubrobacteraceae bacterium]
RVGIAWSIPGATPAAAQARVLDELAAALGALGARVVEVDLPDAANALRAFATIQRVEALAVHVGRGLYPAHAAEYGDDVRARLESARAVTEGDHAAALAERRRIVEAWAGLLASVDLLVMPVSAIAPPPVGADRVVHLGQERDVRDLVMPYTVAQNLVGAPSCVVRAGFDDDGLPVGVQLTAAPGEDAVVLACAAELADATPDVQAPRAPDPAPTAAA